MTHLDPETLALLALGEDSASAADRLHLAGCASCRAELQGFARAVAATRESEAPLSRPGPRVWTGIAEALALDASVADDPFGATGPRAVEAPVRRIGRRRGLVAIIAAAAAVLLLGGVAIGLLTARSGVEPIATAMLHAFPAWRGNSGTAVLERLGNGREVVQVSTTVRPDGRTDHEVWLMTAGARRLVSLGMLQGTSGTFTVPAGIDVSRFRLVDVSDEPRDGNPAHSGNSIVRGVLKS